MKLLGFNSGKIVEQNIDVGATPEWYVKGACFALYGNGDPVLASWLYNGSTLAAPTPTQISISVARCVRFRLPKAIYGSYIKLFSVASVSNYKFAIYNAITGSRVWESGVITTTANDWTSISLSGVQLSEGQDYWFCVTVNGVGTTAAFRTFVAPIHSNFYGSVNSPLKAKSIGLPEFAQFTVASGAFPATLPTILAPSYSSGSGSVPLAFIT